MINHGWSTFPQTEVSLSVNFLVNCFFRWKLNSRNSVLYKFNQGFNCWTGNECLNPNDGGEYNDPISINHCMFTRDTCFHVLKID